tara:strand:+ start:825 stop:1445 length:621 start_codon:yes stop_codon:yes gene_type:complete
MSFAIVAGVAAAASAGIGIARAIKGGADKRAAKKANELARAQMEKDRKAYMNIDTSNPYLNMENTMEDLTVNTQAAEFASQKAEQGMANTLNNMKQSAGGSGIAALAQAMANQGQLAAQEASQSIATQEKQNQALERKEASRIQGLEREGEIQSRNLKQQLASKALQFSAGDVAQTSADVTAAQDQIESGINQVGSAVGTFAGGIG